MNSLSVYCLESLPFGISLSFIHHRPKARLEFLPVRSAWGRVFES